MILFSVASVARKIVLLWKLLNLNCLWLRLSMHQRNANGLLRSRSRRARLLQRPSRQAGSCENFPRSISTAIASGSSGAWCGLTGRFKTAIAWRFIDPCRPIRKRRAGNARLSLGAPLAGADSSRCYGLAEAGWPAGARSPSIAIRASFLKITTSRCWLCLPSPFCKE